MKELNGSETESSLFPLREGIDAETEDELIVKSILRDRLLILEVDYLINSDPNLTADSISVLQVDGSPLPDWLHITDKGTFLSGEPPVGTDNIRVKIEVKLTDGTEIVRYIDVDVRSGEIAALQKVSEELTEDGSIVLEFEIINNLAKLDNESKSSGKTFIN